jgi:membrane-bound ClpP family serine protease
VHRTRPDDGALREVDVLEVLQIVGAVLILVAFIGLQLRRLEPTSYSYLIFNAVGSALLALLAAIGSQWGFLLLEGSWAVISLVGLVNRARAEPR